MTHPAAPPMTPSELAERRQVLIDRIAKLHALGGSPEKHEAATAKRLAAKFQKELDALPAPKTIACEREQEPTVPARPFVSEKHRDFQVAELAARWSGVLLDVESSMMTKAGYFYGPTRRFPKARALYAKIRRALEGKYAAWLVSQMQAPTSEECALYVKGYLLGVHEHFERGETPSARKKRLERQREVQMAFDNRGRRG